MTHMQPLLLVDDMSLMLTNLGLAWQGADVGVADIVTETPAGSGPSASTQAAKEEP